MIFFSANLLAQGSNASYENGRKGKFYFYFGWNGARYTKSDMHFVGEHYDFTLEKVVGKHKPSPFTFEKYLGPHKLTIPQHNFRVGYFLKDNMNISFGFDHMKYVVQADQEVKISGHIEESGTSYDGVYTNDDLIIAEDFLQFENTDGLNYLNIELRWIDALSARKNLSLNLVKGFGAGIMFPKTDATLLNNERHDVFRVSGYGLAGMAGLNLAIRKNFFIQTELKTGFIHLPWLRTTFSKADKAKQNFLFYQYNIVFGTTINFKKSK